MADTKQKQRQSDDLAFNASYVGQKSNQDIHAEQMLYLLIAVVQAMNAAKADDLIFNFQISQAPDGKFVLASLSSTKMVPIPHAA
jgi:hypothetical protein